MSANKIMAQIELCRCQNNSGPYELWILDNRKGFFRLSRHISYQEYKDLLKDPRYDIRLAA